MIATTLLLLATLFLESPCPSTMTERLLPNLIGTAIGTDPVWLVDGSAARFSRERSGSVKTLWVFKTAGRVRVGGHELHTGAKTRFQRQGLGGPIGDEMVFEDPRRESVRPGGVTGKLLSVYAFIPSYVFYPRPGCYQFDVEIDDAVRYITVEIK